MNMKVILEAPEIVEKLTKTRSWIVSQWRRTPFVPDVPILGLNGDGKEVHLSEIDCVTGTIWRFERSKSVDCGINMQCTDLYSPLFLSKGLKMSNDINNRLHLRIKGYEPFKGKAGSVSLQFINNETGDILCCNPNTKKVIFLKEGETDEMIEDKEHKGGMIFKYNCAFELYPMEDM
eukprot:gnl/Chilomastix_caulleri/498.p1 GENE.gnl/Chilomastix_caulleri/498~~gnl/Chilomastix_caulleri/498.p1  ORF type:complete len:177 (+),score=26.97 gnl/Chilomastix_caulleri/498:47-577(+)